MENLVQLEARVAAATQTLAGRQGRVAQLEDFARRLETELHELRLERERLESDLGGAHDEVGRITEQNQLLAGENRRLIGENNRFRGEIERLEGANVALGDEHDRTTRLLAALIHAVEENVEIPEEAGEQAEPATAAVVQMVRAAAPEIAEEEDVARPAHDDNGDIPNEAARRLMDRIRTRIEAHRA